MSKAKMKEFIIIFVVALLAFTLLFAINHYLNSRFIPQTVSSQTAGDQDAQIVQIHNAASYKLLAEERQRAMSVDPTGIPEDERNYVCGPAAIFMALPKLSTAQRTLAFNEYVNQVKQAGNFSTWWRNGMSNLELTSELKRIGVASHSVLDWNGSKAAEIAVQAIDRGHLVFLKVNSAQSFLAITGTSFSQNGDSHIVRIIATHWDKKGRVDGVALYDVNAYNNTDYIGANKRPITYVPYADFVRLLQIQIFPDVRLFISDTPLAKG